jgi:zinc transport system substrate-binding protein
MPLLIMLLLLLLCLQATLVLAASPRVVTSIVPLQEVTAALMTGVTSPEAIITEQASAHHFALRPSHMRLLQQADLVIWIDRGFESGFERIAQVLPENTVQLELLPALGIDSDDGHIWYSPQRLLQVIEVISAGLVEIDPDNQARYRDNAVLLSSAVLAWRDDIQARLQERQPRFIIDHNFTSHLEADLGYAPIATIHDQHDAHGGLRGLGEIEERLRQQPANCLLTLESPPAQLALELAQKYRLIIINPATPTGGDPQIPAIIRRLQQLGAALLECN